MKLLVQTRDRSHKVNKGTLQALEKLFTKLERYLPDPALLEVRIEHLHSKRKGRTHYLHATATIPGEPTTWHVEILAEDFRTAGDRVYEKLERRLRRRHERALRARRSKPADDRQGWSRIFARFRNSS